MARIISNAAPLIILAKADLLYVLEKLFGKITITDLVYNEVMALETYGIVTEDMKIIHAAKFIRQIFLDAKAREDVIKDSRKYGIGVGEMSVARIWIDEKYDIALIEDKIAKERLKEQGVKSLNIWDIGKLAHKENILDIKSFARKLYYDAKYTSYEIEKAVGITKNRGLFSKVISRVRP